MTEEQKLPEGEWFEVVYRIRSRTWQEAVAAIGDRAKRGGVTWGPFEVRTIAARAPLGQPSVSKPNVLGGPDHA